MTEPNAKWTATTGAQIRELLGVACESGEQVTVTTAYDPNSTCLASVDWITDHTAGLSRLGARGISTVRSVAPASQTGKVAERAREMQAAEDRQRLESGVISPQDVREIRIGTGPASPHTDSDPYNWTATSEGQICELLTVAYDSKELVVVTLKSDHDTETVVRVSWITDRTVGLPSIGVHTISSVGSVRPATVTGKVADVARAMQDRERLESGVLSRQEVRIGSASPHRYSEPERFRFPAVEFGPAAHRRWYNPPYGDMALMSSPRTQEATDRDHRMWLASEHPEPGRCLRPSQQRPQTVRYIDGAETFSLKVRRADQPAMRPELAAALTRLEHPEPPPAATLCPACKGHGTQLFTSPCGDCNGSGQVMSAAAERVTATHIDTDVDGTRTYRLSHGFGKLFVQAVGSTDTPSDPVRTRVAVADPATGSLPVPWDRFNVRGEHDPDRAPHNVLTWANDRLDARGGR